MVTSRAAAMPLAAASSTPSRLLLTKATRRALRSIRTEARLFLARPLRRRPWTIPLCVSVVLLAILFVVFRVIHHLSSVEIFHDARREELHFTHDVHAVLPPPASFDHVRSRKCSWLYLEFGAKDGRFLDGFFHQGNHFLEEYLRATQSSMRAFCALAFDADPTMAKLLTNVRNIRGRKARHFNVFTQMVPAETDETEEVAFRSVETGTLSDPVLVSAISLRSLVGNITYPFSESGKEVQQMNTAQGNNNIANVVMRFNVNSMREALWYLQLIEAHEMNGLMCHRVDRLILNFQAIRLNPDTIQGDIDDRDSVRDMHRIIRSPLHAKFSSIKDIESVSQLAAEINTYSSCRTTVHVFDSDGKMTQPKVLSENSIFYAILAGQPTFDERVGAQSETWMQAVPQDRLIVYTNEPRNTDELKAARGRNVAVVKPHQPQLEQHLSMMQSWSHLVRVRESWDRAMRDNPDIKWLGLVDDDTFVFPGAMREYLSNFDSRLSIWGGSGEQARIDNGDAGVFAAWLRDVHKKHGGSHCYMKNEKVPRQYIGTHVEYGVSEVLNGRRVARKVSHMCHDTFCKQGCPAVPQGAAIFVSRSLIEKLRPHIEKCEEDTAKLCKNCGSQRLFMCANRYTEKARTLLTRGICRAPWKLEHREKFPFALTFHGFNRYKGMALSTGSLRGDMIQLWQLGKSTEESVNRGLRNSFLVPMAEVADLIGCHGTGHYKNGSCVTKDGILLDATDGKPTQDKTLAGHHASNRKGSA